MTESSATAPQSFDFVTQVLVRKLIKLDLIVLADSVYCT